MRFEFLFNLIGKSTMAFLTCQSWYILKSWYTGGDPEQGFQHYFADGLMESNSVCGAGYWMGHYKKEQAILETFC